METITHLLYWISNGLMLPVTLLLLYFLAKSILLVGQCYQEHLAQSRVNQQLCPLLQSALPEDLLPRLDVILAKESTIPFTRALGQLLSHQDNMAFCERVLHDYEVEVTQLLGRSRQLIKIGPMLGLMGTLIPMGPALVGLASGDIASMAQHMQLAFATTVVGMVIAIIGVVTLQVKQGYYAKSYNDVEYVLQLIKGGCRR